MIKSRYCFYAIPDRLVIDQNEELNGLYVGLYNE